MEAGIQGFGHGALKHHQLADALLVVDVQSHSVSTSQGTANGNDDHRVVDTYTNAQGVTQTAVGKAPATVSTRTDDVHEHLEQNRKSTSVQQGNTTKTHTDATAGLDKTDHATVTNASGTTTIDAHKDVDAKFSSDSTSVRNGTTTKTDSNSTAAVEVDNHVVVTNPAGATTTYDNDRNVQTATTADSTNTGSAKSVIVKTDDGTLTKSQGESHGSGDSQTDFSIQANGTIVDSHGHTITLRETGKGETDSTWSGSSQSSSVTLAQSQRDGKTVETKGETVSKSSSSSERDSTTKYEGVLSSTTANGKTTTRYVDYVVEEDVTVKTSTVSVDDFTAQSSAATQKAGKPSGTVTQTVDATANSQSAILSQRTDQVHANGKVVKDGDAVVVKSTDHVDAESLRQTAFQTSAHIVTDNGAVTTTADRSVSGETIAATQTVATVHATTSTEHDGGATVQTVHRDTNARSDSHALTNYDTQTTSQSSNGASSSRTDHVVSTTDYNVQRYTRYLAVVRTVVTNADAQSSFAASA